ncbi:MAG: 30S ribosomal protein S15 [Candidatus Thermoplasmatota archaeon]
MARIHARRKGRSGSRRPLTTESPSWVPMEPAEIEEAVVKLASQGVQPAMIGLKLRDMYGVPDVKLATGKSVLRILEDHGLRSEIPQDLANLMRRAVLLGAHLREHPKDIHNMRGLHLIEAKIRRLERYYKDRGVLPATWKYSLETAELQLSR